jgi:hypothetical protein
MIRGIGSFEPLAPFVLRHHEQIDGSGSELSCSNAASIEALVVSALQKLVPTSSSPW